MQNNISCLLLLLALGPWNVWGQTHSKETIVIETKYGAVKLKLFEETPLHKANFLKLVEQHFYDSLLFHRVINQFMIQGGDPLSKTAKPGDSLGHGDNGYTVPAEFRSGIIHRKGRLCAAREGDVINPKKESSACQFYIVMGKVRTPEDLKNYEKKRNDAKRKMAERQVLGREENARIALQAQRLKADAKTDSLVQLMKELEPQVDREYQLTPEFKFSAQQIETYTTIGGTPHLDGAYTVFGEVIEGQEIVDKIAGAATDKRDRPLEDIRMSVKVEK